MPRWPEGTVPLSAGSRFGGRDGCRFRVLEEVGQGGQAVVFRALDTRLSRSVACKVCVDPDSGGRRNFRARFERELELTSRVDHPHVLQVHDCGELPGGFPFVLLEWMHHGSLTGLIDSLRSRGRHLPMSYVSYYARAIGAALRAAHAADVVHRDVKPGNVLLSRDGVAKLTDFGIARDLAPDVLPLTDGGDTLGTPGFMAPEHLAGLPGPISDIFSLGATLYVAITGVMLPQQETAQRIPLGLVLDEAWNAIPPAVAPLLRKLCAARVEDRPESMRAVIELTAATDWSETGRPLPGPGELPPLPSRVFVSGSTSAHEIPPVTWAVMGGSAWRRVATTTPVVAPLFLADTVDLDSDAVGELEEALQRQPEPNAPSQGPPGQPGVDLAPPPVEPEPWRPRPARRGLPTATGLVGLLLGALLVLVLRPSPVPQAADGATVEADGPAAAAGPATQAQPTPEEGSRPRGAVPERQPEAAPPTAVAPGAGRVPVTPTSDVRSGAPRPAQRASGPESTAPGDRCTGFDLAGLRGVTALSAAQVTCLQDTALGRQAASDPDVQEAAVTLYNRRVSDWPAAVEAALARPALANAAALNFAGIKPAYDGGRYAAVVRRATIVWTNLDKGYALSSEDVSFVAEHGCRASAQLAMGGALADDGVAWCDRWLLLTRRTGQPTGPAQDLLDELEGR